MYLFLCSGNAARSVMAGAALSTHLDVTVVQTAGTHAIEGLPMSQRTKLALDSVGLAAPGHRSRQVREEDLAGAELVIALAPEHVRWIRANHPEVAWKTATLRRLCRDLPTSSVEELGFADVELEPWEEVEDPAGGELPDFEACARLIVELVAELAQTLNRNSTTSPSRIT